MRNEKLDENMVLMASILDTVKNIEYGVFQSHTKKKLQKPKSVLNRLLGIDKEEKNDVKGFRSSEDFERERERLLQEA